MYTIWHKHKLNKVSSLDLEYGEIHIKQYHTVTYLGCLLDEILPEESMVLKVINRINRRLRYLYKKAGSCVRLFVYCFVTL